MCGLFGYHGDPGDADPDLVEELAMLAATRGPHAHGWAHHRTVSRRVGPLDGKSIQDLRTDVDGDWMVGHCRLATSGAHSQTDVDDVQPLDAHGLIVAHNGNARPMDKLRAELADRLVTGNDSEWLSLAISVQINTGVAPVTAIANALGACIPDRRPYALIVYIAGGMFAVRRGLPLHAGRRAATTYLCSRPFAGSTELPEETIITP